MTEDAWDRAERLVDAALDMSPADRRPFIRAGSETSEVIEIAFQMIEAFDRQPLGEAGFLESKPKLPESVINREGTNAGGWIIMEKLGEGASGRVYLAKRKAADGWETAAIKFLDGAFVDHKRFQRERELLASLDHDGIAKFIDGGMTSEGVLYVVTQYIQGVPITTFCKSLTISRRLEVFLSLCRVVEAAHDHRVIHRDLKPSNILVGTKPPADRTKPAFRVRVLDFGIAKILDGAVSAGETALTLAGQRLGTRGYMAPEQVDGEPVSFATDVYALGVLLYQLITGDLPFAENALDSSDWKDVVTERVPVLPGIAMKTVRTGGTPPPETQPGVRRAGQSLFSRAMIGDLDAVIMKALAKRSRDRFQRVDQLKREIENITVGLPVRTRRASFWENRLKWTVKHPVSTAALALGGIWAATVIHLGALRLMDYNTQLQNENHAVARFRLLAETALPDIDRALPRNDAALRARLELAHIQADLIRQILSLPDASSRELDRTVAATANRCADGLRAGGELTAALEVINSVVARADWHYRWDPNPQWQRLYADLLRRRIEINGLLQRDTLQDARSLTQIGAEPEGKK